MSSFADIMAYFPVSIVVMDEQMAVVAATREACLMFDVYGHHGSREQNMEHISERILKNQALVSFVGGSMLHLRRPGSSDTLLWHDADRMVNVTVCVLPWSDNSIHYGIRFEDVTGRIDLERAQDNLRVYLERVLDSLPAGVLVIDLDMKITSINTAQLKIHNESGHDADVLQLVGCGAPELFMHNCDPSWDNVRTTVLQDRQTLHGCERLQSAQGHHIVYNITVAPLMDYAGKVVGALRITEDVTDRERLKDEVKKGELMAAQLALIGQVAITLNHEINTALTGIVAFSQLMDRSLDSSNGTQKEYLALIRADAERIRKFVSDFSSLKEIRTESYLNDENEQMISVSPPKPD
jgi:PAS domain S-box-containing protein